MTDLKTIETKALRALEYGDTLKPARDWLILLALFAAAVLISGAWSAWSFFAAESGSEEAASVEESANKPGSALQKADEVMRERAMEAGRYRSEYEFVDPS